MTIHHVIFIWEHYIFHKPTLLIFDENGYERYIQEYDELHDIEPDRYPEPAMQFEFYGFSNGISLKREINDLTNSHGIRLGSLVSSSMSYGRGKMTDFVFSDEYLSNKIILTNFLKELPETLEGKLID